MTTALEDLRVLQAKLRSGDGSEVLRKAYNDTGDEEAGVILDAVLTCADELQPIIKKLERESGYCPSCACVSCEKASRAGKL